MEKLFFLNIIWRNFGITIDNIGRFSAIPSRYIGIIRYHLWLYWVICSINIGPKYWNRGDGLPGMARSIKWMASIKLTMLNTSSLIRQDLPNHWYQLVGSPKDQVEMLICLTT